MELDALNVRHVASEDSHRRMLLHVPHVRSPIVGARCEVIAERCELDVPYRELVTVIHHEARPCLQGPAPDRAVLRARDEELLVERDTHSEDGTGMPHQGKLALLLDQLALLPVWSEVEGQLAVVEGVNERVPLACRDVLAMDLVSVELHLEASLRQDSIRHVEAVQRFLLCERIVLAA